MDQLKRKGFPQPISVRQLAALLDTLPVAFVAHDQLGKVVLWNPAAELLLGWSRDEVLGRSSPLPLASLGCDEVQGYLCGYPADPEEIEAERRAG